MRCNITALYLFAELNAVASVIVNPMERDDDDKDDVRRTRRMDGERFFRFTLVILRNLIPSLIYKPFSVLTDFVKDWNCFKILFFYSL